MPFQAIAYAFREETAGPLCKLITIWLANEADDSGIAHINMGRLVWFCCTTERRVKVALDHLSTDPCGPILRMLDDYSVAVVRLPINQDFDYDAPPPKRRWKPNEEDLELIAFYSGGRRCAACGSKVDIQCDHIWPISKGGWDDRHNIQFLCRECNGAKRAKIGWVAMS